jgi:LPXTG-motif cell wall-anchored protein
MSKFSRHATVLISVSLFMFIFIATAAAHARYVRSEPAQDAVVRAAPQRITIYFSQLLDIKSSSVTVVNASGTSVSQGAAQILATDAKAMQVAVQPNLAPGKYTVNWKNLSAEDGETEEGNFSFSIAAAGAAAPAAPAQAAPTSSAPVPTQLPTTGGDQMAVVQLVMTGGALMFAGAVLRRRRL